MYQLDLQAARESDNFGSYLNETGKYKGKFTRAEALVSKNKGTHGIGFTFETDSKQTTRFDIWTMKPDGETLTGYKALQAIMTVLRVRGIQPVQGTVDRYDYEAKQNKKVQADVFPELTGKPIGLVLRNTEYAKVKDGHETGETGWRLELVAPFDTNEFTASEILDKKTQPEKLASLMAHLADKPMKNRPLAAAPGRVQRQSSAADSGFDDMDDDIPF